MINSVIRTIRKAGIGFVILLCVASTSIKVCESKRVCENEHTWLCPLQCSPASPCICLTGANQQLWGAWKVPRHCHSPVSNLPASHIKVRQSSTLASLHLWHYAAPSWLARSYPPLPLPFLVPQGICHSPVISFINSCLRNTSLQRREGNHRSENGDHFAPVPCVAVAKDNTSGRCWLTVAAD